MTDWRESPSALDRVNGYEVASFLGLHGVETAQARGVLKVMLSQSSDFADASLDPNKIHRKLPGLEQVVSPGFLQACASIALSREAMKNLGTNSLDYPYSLNECEMPDFVITGKEYMLHAEFDGRTKKADVEIKKPNGEPVYRLHRRLFESDPVQWRPEVKGKLVYEGTFRVGREDSIQNFGQLINSCFTAPIGLGSSESHLRALAGASSAINSAVAAGKLNPVEEGFEPVYFGRQCFYLNAKRTLNLQEGIGMKLYVSGEKKFGKRSWLAGISVVGENSEGLLYHFNADLRFMSEKLLAKTVGSAI